MSIQNQHLHRFAAFSMAVFGLYVFFRGVNLGEYRVLEDGSLMDSVEHNLVCFKNSKTILTLRAGFDIYRSICYGVSSFFLLLDLLLNSGYLTLPALVLAGGEIVSDFSDFCLAIVLIAVNIGGYQAAAYGLTYLTLLMVEAAIWLGTCKFHEYCRMHKIEAKMLRKKQEDLSQGKTKRESCFGKGFHLIMVCTLFYTLFVVALDILHNTRNRRESRLMLDKSIGAFRVGDAALANPCKSPPF